MQISLMYQKTTNVYESCDFVDELSNFENNLNRLRQYIEGKLLITFATGQVIELELFADFLLCYPEIYDSINAAKFHKINNSGEIWFCEQGSDFYLNYEIKEESNITITYLSTPKTGKPNNKIASFSYFTSCETYIKEWEQIFHKLSDLFSCFLQKN